MEEQQLAVVGDPPENDIAGDVAGYQELVVDVAFEHRDGVVVGSVGFHVGVGVVGLQRQQLPFVEPAEEDDPRS